MSKLEPQYRGCIESWIYRDNDGFLKFLHSLCLTPNMVTTLSNVVGIGALWALWNKQLAWFSVLFIFSFYLDCLDGKMARVYKMSSNWGGTYDNVSDIALAIALIIVVACKVKNKTHLIAAGIVVFLMWFCNSTYELCTIYKTQPKKLGAQQRWSVNHTKFFCPYTTQEGLDRRLLYTKRWESPMTVLAVVIIVVSLFSCDS